MANNLNEIVLTPRTIKHLSFDDDVVDLAFVFTKEQLLESGTYLDGITNAYICRFEENVEPVNGLMPFLCPLSTTFPVAKTKLMIAGKTIPPNH